MSCAISETLEAHRVQDLTDLAPLVSGLTVTSTEPGTSRVTMRGINTGGVASTVGIYSDDVPFGSSSGLANGAVVIKAEDKTAHPAGGFGMGTVGDVDGAAFDDFMYAAG